MKNRPDRVPDRQRDPGDQAAGARHQAGQPGFQHRVGGGAAHDRQMGGDALVEVDDLVRLGAGQVAALGGELAQPVPLRAVPQDVGVEVHRVSLRSWSDPPGYADPVSQLVTGDAVVLDLRPARIPTRLLATGVDLVLMWGATFLYGYIVDTIGGSEARVRAVTIAGALIINFGYPITMETLTRGRTVGAFALGLRAVRDDGGAIRFRQALLRGLAFWTVDFAIWTGFCGGLVCAAINPQSKRFGDLMAGTLVIRTRAPGPAADPRGAAGARRLGLAARAQRAPRRARHRRPAPGPAGRRAAVLPARPRWPPSWPARLPPVPLPHHRSTCHRWTSWLRWWRSAGRGRASASSTSSGSPPPRSCRPAGARLAAWKGRHHGP